MINYQLHAANPIKWQRGHRYDACCPHIAYLHYARKAQITLSGHTVWAKLHRARLRWF